MKTDALMEKIKGWTEQLAAQLKEGHTQGLVTFLERAGRFHRYSYHNTLLILMQQPNATLVAGLKRWNELGRRVKKGERAIAILAPTLKREERVDEITGEVRVVQRLVSFHTAYVFDISQTEGEPVEIKDRNPQGAEVYGRLRRACPVPVEEQLMPEGFFGKTDGKRIFLASVQSPTAKAETLLHEWAHTLLHFDEARRGAQVEELEAEATAFVVGRELGLPMQGSRDYILQWQGGVEGLEGSLERIMRAAREILACIQGHEIALAAA
ncbi:ArdC-like ssDNA-binding domain-containing protein [Meiothermus sp. CFH 77666]|uniref:ArdC-like ssDNA-binding domain-containing protein n=1 Tax=Meiothermus sp. CFH 77666 TaxID=2817942 RepID=UPI001AA013B7|nr:ArdC-like ssDNA-binding domain-containing protein [Meiothermus sp. CFH 77666]MBO1438607.1 ImmA/IrrE family metallo-endopeptidase [Meiothermus sp. CFH 77666]